MVHFNVILVVTALLLVVSCGGVPEDDLTLTILHNNDMHSRFAETSKFSGKCAPRLGPCYGGFARVAHVVNKTRAEKRNVLFLNAGDTFQGTVWYTVHKWKVVAHFIEMLGIDVMSLGNHEFDDHVAGLVPFLEHISVPVVASNLELNKEPELAKHIKPSVVLTVDGVKVGVIGYLTPETKDISNPDRVEFLDEVSSVRREADRLAGQGVTILIALGHSGYRMDEMIAREVENIDLVIGGHSNTFLYTGPQPDNEVPYGPYPSIIKQSSGRRVPVVQAYAYTKYLGRLEMRFDAEGEMVAVEGNAILLDNSVPQDEHVLKDLEPWSANVTVLAKKEIGKTRVFLNGSFEECRMRECNMGNFLADSLVHYVSSLYSGEGWTDTPIGIQNGGGIRNSIDEKANNGSVTMEDMLSVLPFENGVIALKLEGKYILEMLELSVHRYDVTGSDAPGQFLQFSGLQVTYDISQPSGRRVVQVLARCGDCRVPTFKPLDSKAKYGVIMNSYIAHGGDGYHMIPKYSMDHIVLETSESDIVAHYIKVKSPIHPGVEGRIRFTKGLKVPQRQRGAAEMSRSSLVIIITVAIAIFACK